MQVKEHAKDQRPSVVPLLAGKAISEVGERAAIEPIADGVGRALSAPSALVGTSAKPHPIADAAATSTPMAAAQMIRNDQRRLPTR